MFEVEEWRPVVGWEGLYEVSSLGRVRSLDRLVRRKSKHGIPYDALVAGRALTPHLHRYYRTQLGRGSGTIYVHHLVCIAFNGVRPPGQQAAHLDGNPQNNRASNLAWVPVAENCRHKFAHGTQPLAEQHRGHKLSSEDVREIRELRGKSLQRELAARFGVNQTIIGRIQAGLKRRYD